MISFHDAFTIAHAGTGIELHGTTGSVIGRDLLMPDPVGEVVLRREDDLEAVSVPERWPLYENAIARFDMAVRGEGSPLASGRDGIASLACALAARESAGRGGAAVRVDHWLAPVGYRPRATRLSGATTTRSIAGIARAQLRPVVCATNPMIAGLDSWPT